MPDRSVVFMIPGDLETLTGGYGYDRRIIDGLLALGWRLSVESLDGSFPNPTPDARQDARRRLAAVVDDAVVLIDGLAFGVLDEEAHRERERLRLVALVHHPLVDETGLDAATARRLEISEKRALEATRLVIVTSTATASALHRFGIAADRLAIVEPGTDPAALARGSPSGPLHLLCVASLTPRKGHEVLIRALAQIKDKAWRLTCVGNTDRDQETMSRVRTLLGSHGLTDRVRFTGDLHQPHLDRAYDAADVFVLPTFHEGYGMVIAEALARGLPVISTPTGAITELVGFDAGILVPPGNADALAAALTRVIDHPATRHKLAAGARRVRDRLPTWGLAARRMADALERVARE